MREALYGQTYVINIGKEAVQFRLCRLMFFRIRTGIPRLSASRGPGNKDCF